MSSEIGCMVTNVTVHTWRQQKVEWSLKVIQQWQHCQLCVLREYLRVTANELIFIWREVHLLDIDG